MADTFPPADLAPLAKQVSDLLRRRGEKVCIVETACGGLMSASLLALPGASAIFAGSQTLYTLPSRVTLADWTPEHVAQYGGPTLALVEGLCVSLRNRLSTDPFPPPEQPPATTASSVPASGAVNPANARAPLDPAAEIWARRRTEAAARLWALGESGTAGPGRSGEGQNRTPGYVALAVVRPDGARLGTETSTGRSDRVGNMVEFARAGLQLLLRALEEAQAQDRL